MTRIYVKIIILMFSLAFSQETPSLFEYEQSMQQSFYFFDNVLINDNQIDSDDWVGAFNGGICVGSRQWDTSVCGGGVCDVPVMGDDGSELTNGYMILGDIPTFKIYDSSEDIYYDATPEGFINPDDGDLTLCEWTNFGFCNLVELFYQGPVLGCLDGNACNYNSEATQDDGTCEYAEQNFDCEGNCIIQLDCEGTCGGEAELDDCGECGGNGIIQDCGCGPPGELDIPDGECDCEGNIEDCNGECGGNTDDCNINISFNPDEFDDLVLFTNLNVNQTIDSICIEQNISLVTIGELNVEIGDCIPQNGQETIPIYITNEFYITNFNISLTGLILDSSIYGANGGLIDYIGYDWNIVGNTIFGQILNTSEYEVGLMSNCTNLEACNNQTADINDENLCIYPMEYWFDLDSDGLGYGDPVEYCLDNLPGGWVLNNNDICPEDPEDDEDGDGICACFNNADDDCDDYPECYYNYYDCNDECIYIGSGEDDPSHAIIDECGECVLGNTGLEENYLDLGCGCNNSEPLEYWEDVDNDGLGSGAIDIFCLDEIPPGWILVDISNEDPYPDCYDNFYDECYSYWTSLGTPQISCGGDGILEGNCDCAGNLPITYCIDTDGDAYGNAEPDTWISLCDDEYQNNPDILIPVEGGSCTDENEDCIGMLDDCGICEGNNADQYCNGDCFGNADIDECGVCSGGSTGLTPNADQDECGVCNGENLDQDCLGDCFGNAGIDDCGICDGNIYLDEDGELYNGLFCDCELTLPNNCGECIEDPCNVSAFFPTLIDNDFKSFIEIPVYLNGYTNNSVGLEGLEFQFTYDNTYYDLDDNGIIVADELIDYVLEYHNYPYNDTLNKVEIVIYASEEPINSLSSENNIVNLNFTLKKQDDDYGYLHNQMTDLRFIDDFTIGTNIIETSDGLVEFKTVMCLDSFASNFCDNEEPDVPSIPEEECLYYNNQQNYIITEGLCEYLIELEVNNDGSITGDIFLTNGDNSIELFIDSETVIILNDDFDGEISFSQFYNNNTLPEPSSDDDIPLILWGDVISFEPYEIMFQDQTGQVTINMEFIPFGERGALEYDLYKLDDLDDTDWERVEIQSCGENACSAQVNSFGLYSVVLGGLGCIDQYACNFNQNAIVDDGSCFYAADFGEYCEDLDYDSLGEPSDDDELVYFCPENILDGWVNNCLDPEPNCPNPDSETLLIDLCGVCNGDNQCFEYPDEFIDSWILTEQNQYADSHCFEYISGNLGPFNADFINEDGVYITNECLGYKMVLQYTEPCVWDGASCLEIDNNCSSNDNQALCEYNNYCIWDSNYCIELNNNCKELEEAECISNTSYSNLGQLICVTNEYYDPPVENGGFGGGWIYEEELSEIFEWGVAENQLCFNSYGINEYDCIDYVFVNNENEIRLQYVQDGYCAQNTYLRDSFLNISPELIPNEYKLYENYPNPFNPITNISFEIPKSDYISLDIYNIKGQHISNIINQYLPPGYYEFQFDGSNLSSGIYFVILYSNEFIKSNKMVLIK